MEKLPILTQNSFYRKKKFSEENLIVIGVDGTAENTGTNKGAITLLELKIGRPLQWTICRLHLNELPFWNLFEFLDWATIGPNSYKGPIGLAINTDLRHVVLYILIIDSVIIDILWNSKKSKDGFTKSLKKSFRTLLVPRDISPICAWQSEKDSLLMKLLQIEVLVNFVSQNGWQRQIELRGYTSAPSIHVIFFEGILTVIFSFSSFYKNFHTLLHLDKRHCHVCIRSFLVAYQKSVRKFLRPISINFNAVRLG